jgi:hypothetical protein
MMGITAVEIDRQVWKKSLREFKHSIFITSEWLEALADEKIKSIYIDFVKDGQVIGKISGLITNGSILKGKQLYHYAGPALRETDLNIYQDCLEALRRFAIKRRFSRIRIGSYDQQTMFSSNGRGYLTTERKEFRINFDTRTPFEMLTKEFKKNLKKGRKSGATVVQSKSPELLNTLIHLLGKTRERRISKYGVKYNPFYVPYLSEKALTKLLNTGFLRIYHTIKDSEINCMAADLCNGYNAFGLLQASDEHGYRERLSTLLSYSRMESFLNASCLYYNLGGTVSSVPGENLTRFKKSMGAEEVTVYGVKTNYLIFPFNLINFVPCVLGGLSKKSNAIKSLVSFFKQATSQNWVGGFGKASKEFPGQFIGRSL